MDDMIFLKDEFGSGETHPGSDTGTAASKKICMYIYIHIYIYRYIYIYRSLSLCLSLSLSVSLSLIFFSLSLSLKLGTFPLVTFPICVFRFPSFPLVLL